jgi:ATP-dependent DNA helicase RecG
MDDDSVLALIRGPESEQVERKERLKPQKDEVCQVICAFAHDLPRTGKPGVVVIGQADNGKPTGLAVTDGLLLELADLRTNSGIVPFPQISVRRLELDGTAVAVIVVEPRSRRRCASTAARTSASGRALGQPLRRKSRR